MTMILGIAFIGAGVATLVIGVAIWLTLIVEFE